MARRLLPLLLTWAAVVWLTGCATPYPLDPNGTDERHCIGRDACTCAIDAAFGYLARTLCACDSGQCEPVVITDFVAVPDYRGGTIGKVLSEEFRLAWQRQCPQPVRLVELAQNYRLDEKEGLALLTRDVAALLTPENRDATVLVGTHHVRGDTVRLFVRRVDLISAAATAMTGATVPLRCLQPLPKLPRTLLD